MRRSHYAQGEKEHCRPTVPKSLACSRTCRGPREAGSGSALYVPFGYQLTFL